MQLRRSLSLLDVTMINVGTMIGSGIFIVPAAIALQLTGIGWNLGVWVAAAALSLLGALTFGELGATLPQAGGLVVYLREAYGPIWGFFYGWTVFIVIQTGSIAAVSVAFATYLGHFVPLGPIGIKLVAIAAIAALTLVNAIGVRAGARTQNVVTIAKLVVIALLIAVSFGSSAGSMRHLATPAARLSSALVGAFGTALVAALWAFDGWIHTSYVGGEVENPGRNIPISTVASVVVVTVVYLALNLGCHYVLGQEGVARSSRVAADTAAAAIGGSGAGFASALIALATLGCVSGMILAGGRIYYAMAREGLFFTSVGQVHPRYRTPANSLWLQGLWSIALALSGRYDQLFTYVVFASWVFYGMGAAAIFVLRGRPGLSSPYRVWSVVPAAFVVLTIALLCGTVINDPRDAAIGLALMLAGVPAYFWFRRVGVISNAGEAL
jgi:APA family basic amino acid/polyamine antiporter